MVVEKMYTHVEENVHPDCTPFMKINSKWTIDQNVNGNPQNF